MTIHKTKPDRVVVSAGASVEVTINGVTKHYHCSGSNEKTGRTAADVIKNIQDCIKEVSKGKRRKK